MTDSFQWEISNGNCPVSSDIINIRIDEAPSISLAGADQNLCEVTSTNLNATLPAIGIGSWTQISGNPTTIVNSFDPNTIIDGLSIGTFVYQWTVSTSGACPDAIDQVVIVVNPIPDATFTTIPTNLCAYDASITIVPNQSGGTFSPTFTGFDGVTLDPATTSSGPHSITYDINILGCVNSSTQTFNINPAPTVSIDGLPTQICADLLLVDLNGSPAGGSFFGTGGSVTGTVASGFEFNPTLAGSYSVTYSYTDPLTLCSNNISQNVDVITSYDASFTGDASVYCESDTTSLLTPITAGGTFFGDGISGNIFDPNLTAGSHTIGYTVGVGACTDTVLHTIMIYDNIIPTIDNLNVSYCINNGPVSLAATPSGGTWSGTGMAGNIFYPEVASIGGPYTLTYTYVNGGVCTNSTTADVTVTPVIIPQISANAIVCLDDTLIVNYTGSTSNISAFNWEFEEADYVAGTGSGPYYVVWNTEGYFDVNLSLVQADGCIVDTTFTIYVEEPSVQTISDMTVHYNESVILNTVIQPYTNNNPISVQWLPSSYLSCDTCEIPIANPLDDVTYIVTITDENGCTDQDTVTITVYIDDEIFVPTAFTPNDDGNNDVW